MKIRRIISSFLVLMLFCYAFDIQMFINAESPYYYFEYGIGNQANVIKKYTGFESNVVLPKENANVRLSIIGADAFINNNYINKVTIPEGYTEIKEYAFSSCAGLTSVSLPNTMQTIGAWSFSKCNNLKSISIPKSVVDIRTNAFYSPNLTVYVVKGSYAENYVRNNGVRYKYTSSQVNSVQVKQATKISGVKSSYKKAYGDKAFSLGVKSNSNGKKTYSSNNKKVVTVSSNGRVTIKGVGTAKITIKIGVTSKFKAAAKTVTIKVNPRNPSNNTIKFKRIKKSRNFLLSWENYKGPITGIEVWASKNKNFKSVYYYKYSARTKKICLTLSKGTSYYKIKVYKNVGSKSYSSSKYVMIKKKV